MDESELVQKQEKKYQSYLARNPLPEIENQPMNTDEENKEHLKYYKEHHIKIVAPNELHVNKIFHIIEKTPLERAYAYRDQYPCLSLRKIVIIMKCKC